MAFSRNDQGCVHGGPGSFGITLEITGHQLVAVAVFSFWEEEAVVMFERTSIGLDVHARTVVGCAIDGGTGEVFRQRLTPDFAEVLA